LICAETGNVGSAITGSRRKPGLSKPGLSKPEFANEPFDSE